MQGKGARNFVIAKGLKVLFCLRFLGKEQKVFKILLFFPSLAFILVG